MNQVASLERPRYLPMSAAPQTNSSGFGIGFEVLRFTARLRRGSQQGKERAPETSTFTCAVLGAHPACRSTFVCSGQGFPPHGTIPVPTQRLLVSNYRAQQ